jgi:hypothetical protein
MQEMYKGANLLLGEKEALCCAEVETNRFQSFAEGRRQSVPETHNTVHQGAVMHAT